MIVLDASAVVDVVLDRPSRDRVLDHLAGGVSAPAHQPAEALSAIARLGLAGPIGPGEARRALSDLAELHQDVVPPTAAHLHRALDLQERIRVVDGLYVALAEDRRCPLVTTDARIAGADPPCEVILAT